MQISFNNGNNKEYMSMLNNFLKNIFFDFTFWYDLNLWDDKYESYSIIDNDEIVANICVFKTEVLYNGVKHQALSVGAVATKEECRGRGYSRILLEHIINKYEGTPMYLYANDSVLDFYPRFGFKRVYEKLPVCKNRVDNDLEPVKLRFDDPKIYDYIYNRVNYSDRLDCLNTASINIFHIYWGYLKEHLYELAELDTLVIAEQNGTTLKLTGVYSKKPVSFLELTEGLPFKNVERIEFGFMPYWSDINYIMQEYETEPMFVRALKCNPGDFKFPELSIT